MNKNLEKEINELKFEISVIKFNNTKLTGAINIYRALIEALWKVHEKEIKSYQESNEMLARELEDIKRKMR